MRCGCSQGGWRGSPGGGRRVDGHRKAFALTFAGLVTTLTFMGIASAQSPTQVPLFEQFQDLNPCMGAVVTYTFSGTARIIKFDDHFILVAKGSVVTSDGFSGSFNRKFVFQGDQETVFRFHALEISAETAQFIWFAVGRFV